MMAAAKIQGSSVAPMVRGHEEAQSEAALVGVQADEAWANERLHRQQVNSSFRNCPLSHRAQKGLLAARRYLLSYCFGTGGGAVVPPNQPAAYAIATNITITATTPYQRRLSLKSIVHLPR
jgi:hypothetical protein